MVLLVAFSHTIHLSPSIPLNIFDSFFFLLGRGREAIALSHQEHNRFLLIGFAKQDMLFLSSNGFGEGHFFFIW